VEFSITGPGRILGVGNGNPASHEPDRATSRRLFNGLAQVLVQTSRDAGEITLSAAAEGLRSVSLKLLAVPSEGSPEAPPADVRWFIVDWRRSPVSTDRPDPTQSIEASDMNTWERVQLTPTSHATHDRGFVMLRAPLKLPRAIAREGGELVFDAVAGQVEVYLDARRVADADRSTPGPLRVPLPPDQPPAAITVLIRSTDAPAGVVGAVAVVGASGR
jgi:beta-galactosidase